MATIKLLLVDDHVVVRSGLAAYVDAEPDMEVVAEAGSFEEADRSLTGRNEIDVAVIDLRLPDGSGIECLAQIARARPEIRSLILSVNAGENDILTAVEAGACGYLPKSAEREELIDAIRVVAAGGTYFPAPIRRKLEEGHTRPKLTERERDILEHLVKGLSNKEIAVALDVADITARQYVSNILRKLGVQDRTQAAIVSIREGHVRMDEPRNTQE